MDILELRAREPAKVRLVLPDVVEGALVVEDHHGLGVGMTGRLDILTYQLLGIEQGVRVALDLAGLPAQLDDEALQLALRRGLVGRTPLRILVSSRGNVCQVNRTEDASDRLKQIRLEPGVARVALVRLDREVLLDVPQRQRPGLRRNGISRSPRRP